MSSPEGWAGADLLWGYHPNGGDLAAVYVPPDAAERLCARGWLKIDGRRAMILEREPGANRDGSIALRIRFDERYPRCGGQHEHVNA